ncbi:MAG: ABC transporter permease [Synechococcales bacterium]|nr:ABC transporter permease [Synechococcales bacterium]
MSFILNHPTMVLILLLQHLQMTGLALVIATLLALPIALLISHYRWLVTPILTVLGILYTVPSLALIILLVPFLGLTANAVIVAMVLYAQVILVRSLTVGLQQIDPAIVEAAMGMGMNGWQRWWQVQFPLVLPMFLAGLRLAAIVEISIATIGAKFGAGGLGVLLFDGIAQAGRYDKIWAGAIAVGMLALLISSGLLLLEWIAQPGSRMTMAVWKRRIVGTID